MKVEIKIPAMGESVTQAIVSTILKESGSCVKSEEEILELETDKVNQLLYAPQSGILTLLVKVDDKVQIGQVIGFIDTEAKGSEGSHVKEELKEVKTQKSNDQSKVKPTQIEEKKGNEGSSRRMQEQFLNELKEEKKGELKKNVESLPASKPAGAEEVRKRMTTLRRTIAQKLVEVKNQTAMLTTFNEVDMSTIIEIREKEKESFVKKYGIRLGFMSFFVKAVVAALQEIRGVNAYIDGDEIVFVNTYDIGIAVSTDKGLMVPVVQSCDQLSFGQIETAIELFAKKARDGKISIEDLKGGSFTITNGGRFGSLLSTPILNPPQSAILGMHAIVKRPVVVDDAIVIRPMMYLALSYDHRLIDGKEAVLFLVHLKKSLEDPTRLLLHL